MTRRRWLLVITMFLILIITASTLFYRDVQMGRWNEKAKVRASLEQSYDLTTETYLEKYIWDDQYWILQATTLDGEEQYAVWQNDIVVSSIAVQFTVSAEEVWKNLQKTDATIINTSIQAAYFYGQLAWEIQYTNKESEQVKYAFFAMSDGHLINEYTIPKETRSF